MRLNKLNKGYRWHSALIRRSDEQVCYEERKLISSNISNHMMYKGIS